MPEQYSQSNHRGIALVIGNGIFDTKPKQENIDIMGVFKDIEIMKKILEKLDFFVMCYKNLTAAKMKEKISKASTDPRNKDCDNFVMVLSTHGRETFDKKANVWRHEVMGTDRNYVQVDDILQMFDKKTATDLDGKPKIFFIQACRNKDLPQMAPLGLDEDKGIEAMLPVLTKSALFEKELPKAFDDDGFTSGCDKLYEGWSLDPECWTTMQNALRNPQKSDMDASVGARGIADSNELPPEPVDILSITCPNDCLIYYPAMSGKAAFLSDGYGSLMMRCLREQFPKLLRGDSLNNYLTFVNRAMAERVITYKGEKLKVTASVLHRMTKQVRFEPKSPNSPMAKAQKMIGIKTSDSMNLNECGPTSA